jgi:hypothetical protein
MNFNNVKKPLLIAVMLLGSSAIFAGDPNTPLPPAPYNQHVGAYFGGDLGAGLGASKDQSGDTQGGFEGFGGTATVGYQLNPNFGIEGDFTGISAPFSSTFYIYGAMLRALLPLGDRVSLYAKAGGGAITVRVCDFLFNTGQCVSETQGAVLVGGGLTVALSPNFDLAMDYTGGINNNNGMDGLYGVLGAGFLYHF